MINFAGGICKTSFGDDRGLGIYRTLVANLLDVKTSSPREIFCTNDKKWGAVE